MKRPPIVLATALATFVTGSLAAASQAQDTEPSVAEYGDVLFLLPGAAYPDRPLRGIPGGSLAATFHGMQWPYLPTTGVGVSGSLWVDSGYEHIDRGDPNQQNLDYWLQQGRAVLRFTPTYSRGDYFLQGQMELVANKDQSTRQPDVADTDDLWIRAGQWNTWDVQLGRFEAWEVYHFGMGLDLHTLERQGATDEVYSPPAIYGLTYAFYRPANVGQVAFHLYPTEYLRFEVGTQVGNEFGSNALAARPVGVLDLGWLKLKVGGEYKVLADQKEGAKGETMSRGVAGGLALVLAPYVEFGANAAIGLVDRVAADGTTDEKASNTTYSIGGFANWTNGPVRYGLISGIGFDYTRMEDIHNDPALGRVQHFRHIQSFAAVQYRLWDQLSIKGVFAFARADFVPNFGATVYHNEMWSGRIRLQYAF